MNVASPAAILMLVLGTAACTTETAPTEGQPATPPASNACGADQYQQFIGQKSPKISVPPGTPTRSFKTGDPVTMDFNAGRLNFEYDAAGVLVKVSCF